MDDHFVRTRDAKQTRFEPLLHAVLGLSSYVRVKRTEVREVLSYDLSEFKDRQVHGNDKAANYNTEKHHDDWFHE